MDVVARSLVAEVPPVSSIPGWDVVTILVTVKAYPAIARQSGESVCVAGVRLDTDRPEWIRLFPVGFRDLPRDRQFEKYQVVRLRVRRGSSDRRPESYKPDLNSLVLGPTVATDHAWRRRWDLLDSLAGATTTCDLVAASRERGQSAPSLGLVKPVVHDIEVADNPDYRTGAATQVDVDLFGEERDVLEATPFLVHYRYSCAATECPGHRQSIIDWESGQFARRNLERGVRVARERHRAKFLEQLCGPDRDAYFYVGNQHQHPGSYLVLGVFWPPAGSRPQPTFTW